jgi:hypothetical protein
MKLIDFRKVLERMNEDINENNTLSNVLQELL